MIIERYADLWIADYKKYGREWWEKQKQVEISVRGERFVNRVIKIMNEKRNKK